jgi:hypothetical protein
VVSAKGTRNIYRILKHPESGRNMLKTNLRNVGRECG